MPNIEEMGMGRTACGLRIDKKWSQSNQSNPKFEPLKLLASFRKEKGGLHWVG